MNRAQHYLESERMIQTVLDGSAAIVGKAMTQEQAVRAQTTFALQLHIAQVHATLATASVETERLAADAAQFAIEQERFKP